MKKELDRHLDPEMLTYPLRIERESYDAVTVMAKNLDRTRAWVMREAIRVHLERAKRREPK